MKPKLLDLFCGAGGCSRGYELAGFEIVAGVDIVPQKRYPYYFVRDDALLFLKDILKGNILLEFDFIHASPPCQAYTKLSALWDNDHPDLIEDTRELLRLSGRPYVIENVVDAPLLNPIMLCGTSFGLDVIRHRNFEIDGFEVKNPPSCNHVKPVVDLGRWPDPETEYHCPVGHFSNVSYAREAMQIDWMSRNELSQAVPPAYTKWIGDQFTRDRKWTQ